VPAIVRWPQGQVPLYICFFSVILLSVEPSISTEKYLDCFKESKAFSLIVRPIMAANRGTCAPWHRWSQDVLHGASKLQTMLGIQKMVTPFCREVRQIKELRKPTRLICSALPHPPTYRSALSLRLPPTSDSGLVCKSTTFLCISEFRCFTTLSSFTAFP
jgi:hypothetical protein